MTQMTEQEVQEALPINCWVFCIHAYQCTPFINPVACTRIELKNDVKQAIKQAGYVLLAEDQSFPEFLTLRGITASELVDAVRESYQKAGFRRIRRGKGL